MGNCQAAEAATVVIQHPGGTVERIYWSVSANEVMGANPGHYVAAVTPAVSANGTPVKQLKLLRPDDTLHIGHVYRLISFEEVLKEFAGKKYTKLSKLLSMQRQIANSQGKEGRADRRGRGGAGGCGGGGGRSRGREEKTEKVEQEQGQEQGQVCRVGIARGVPSGTKQRQWKPALQSIEEVGS
ncbi:hypothetical protein H6P81_020739 [Aristolochia fimbriata]|uniref:Uncharacterized protein n=1 Tax=Aristolochia fimbriata TaxID=158543 RepID=A0AAV7DX42_ARIFI|nr:hypothetical protein H6P81_020739 [Aristolochia fimbriata]